MTASVVERRFKNKTYIISNKINLQIFVNRTLTQSFNKRIIIRVTISDSR